MAALLLQRAQRMHMRESITDIAVDVLTSINAGSSAYMACGQLSQSARLLLPNLNCTGQETPHAAVTERTEVNLPQDSATLVAGICCWCLQRLLCS
jgi:hypothetical protein